MAKTIVNNNIKLKSGGGVINDATDGLSVDTTIYPATPTMPAYENLVAGDLLKTINDGGTYKVKKIVGISANITGTTPRTLNGAYIDFCFIDTNKIAVAYISSSSLWIVIGTISGSTITFGTSAAVLTFTSIAGYDDFHIRKVATDSFVVVYGYTTGSVSSSFATAGTVSTRTITLGTEAQLGTETSNSRPAVLIEEIDTAKFVVTSIRQNTNFYNCVITISGNAITVGSAVHIDGTTTSLHFLMKLDTNTYVSFYEISNKIKYQVDTVSNITINEGTIKIMGGDINGEFLSAIYTSVNNGIITYNKNGTSGKIYFRTFSNNAGTITFGTEVEITATLTLNTQQGAKVLIDNGFLYFITATNVLKLEYNTTTSDFYLVKNSTALAASISGGLATNNVGRIFINSLANGTTLSFKDFLLDHDEFITSANASYTAGASVPLVNIFTGFTGLTAGYDYYINSLGTLPTISNTYQSIGKAINTTTIIKS